MRAVVLRHSQLITALTELLSITPPTRKLTGVVLGRNIWGWPLSCPPSALAFPSLFPLHVEVDPLKFTEVVLGSVLSSRSWVCDVAPAEIE